METFKSSSGEVQKEKRRAIEKAVFVENIYDHIQNGGRNMDSKGPYDEVSDRDEEHAIGQQRKVSLY